MFWEVFPEVLSPLVLAASYLGAILPPEPRRTQNAPPDAIQEPEDTV